MFETSVISMHPAAHGRVRLLTASLGAHSALIVGAVVLSVASVEFPTRAPDEFAQAPALVSLRMPPPFGTPGGGNPPKQAASSKVEAIVTPGQITAPPQTPETIQPIEGTSTIAGENAGGSTIDGGAGALGVPWGVEGGMGDLDGPPVTAEALVESRIYAAAEVNAPVLIHRVEPVYPQVMMRTRMPATVVVRCVIDRNGLVRSPEIMTGSMPPFNDAVIAAVSKWRFRPGSVRGQAVDSWLDLTVNFSVK